MQATIIQQPGSTWQLVMDIPAFTAPDKLDKIVEEGYREAVIKHFTEQMEEAAYVTVATACMLLSIETPAVLRRYGKLPAKDPRHLPISDLGSAKLERINLAHLKQWAERLGKKETKEKITAYEAKHAKM